MSRFGDGNCAKHDATTCYRDRINLLSDIEQVATTQILQDVSYFVLTNPLHTSYCTLPT